MLDVPFFRRPPPALKGDKLYLRPPGSGDYAAWARIRAESRSFLEPWEPRWSTDELSRAAYRQRLKRYRSEYDAGTGVAFFLYEKATDVLVGGLNLSNIRRGVAQAGSIGYWMGERHAGQGMMFEALRLVIPFAFDTLRLHRLEAACIPDNERSIGLLEKAGFQREGLLKAYLKINGEWRDHYLYALIADKHRDQGAEIRG